MARLDADLLLMAYVTAHYTDALTKGEPMAELRGELSAQALEVAKSVEDLIDNRVSRILEEKRLGT